MRLVIQRVKSAQVVVSGKTVGQIDHGALVLVGVGLGDTPQIADKLAEKLVKLRIMADSEHKMNESVAEVGGKFLVVSQFTLYSDTSAGNRPSFAAAAKPEVARGVYDHFVAKLVALGTNVETGVFGENMQISTDLDGPVTINIDSNGKD